MIDEDEVLRQIRRDNLRINREIRLQLHDEHEEEEEVNNHFIGVNRFLELHLNDFKEMTGMEHREFLDIVNLCRDHLTDAGRGKRSLFTPEDKLFYLFSYMHTNETLRMLGGMFKISPQHLEHIIIRTAKRISTPLLDTYAHIRIHDPFGKRFDHFPPSNCSC